MSYTLRGRLESRLGVVALALAAACVLSPLLREWWPVELAALMSALGLTLDLAYDRVLPYQPGWVALPLGALELGLTYLAARALDVQAPLGGAIAFFGAVWLVSQILGHALYPLLRVSYAEDGGELGLAGPGAALAAVTLGVGAGSVAWISQPPTVHLAGVVRGPLVITRSERLQGEPGTLVRGGIRVLGGSDVTIRDLAITGGTYGIEIDGPGRVRVEHVSIAGAQLDGIHVRRSTVAIHDCAIDSRGNAYAQGIDISFTYDLGESMVDHCTIVGGQEGIVVHSARVMLSHNRVSRTTLRGIAVTEMSMGMVERNEVRDARGIGVLCGDRSMCQITRNHVRRMTPLGPRDGQTGGWGIVAWFDSEAEVRDNDVNAARAFAGSRILRR